MHSLPKIYHRLYSYLTKNKYFKISLRFNFYTFIDQDFILININHQPSKRVSNKQLNFIQSILSSNSWSFRNLSKAQRSIQKEQLTESSWQGVCICCSWLNNWLRGWWTDYVRWKIAVIGWSSDNDDVSHISFSFWICWLMLIASASRKRTIMILFDFSFWKKKKKKSNR